MSNVEQLKAAIEALPEPEFIILRHWFGQKDWEKWDEQLEADSNAGRLNFLIDEARGEKEQGNLRDL